jgi:hypothetical protein
MVVAVVLAVVAVEEEVAKRKGPPGYQLTPRLRISTSGLLSRFGLSQERTGLHMWQQQQQQQQQQRAVVGGAVVLLLAVAAAVRVVLWW